LQLIRRKHLNDYKVRFIERVYHEDELFSFLSLMQANRVSHVRKSYYIRRVRADSIMTETRGFKHFRGYLSAFIQILSFTSQREYSNETNKQIKTYLERTRNELMLIYADNEESEKWITSLDIIEQYYVKFFVLQIGGSDSLRQQILELNKEISRIYNSKTWRVGSKLHKVYRFFIPDRAHKQRERNNE